MNEEEYEELARWLPCHPGRWVAWPEPFGTRAEADALFESLRDGGLESFKVDSAALRWRIDEVNLPDLTVGASMPFAEMIASGMAT